MEQDKPVRDRGRAADARHWRLSRRSAGGLTLVWFLATFVLPLFGRDLGFDVFGAPAAIWFASQGAPLVYLLIVWRHERRLEQLDREHRAAHAE